MRVLTSLIVLACLVGSAWSWQPSSRVVLGSLTTNAIVSAKNVPQRPSSLLAATEASTEETQADTKSTEWTKPRLHNSPAFRSAAILTVLALASQTAPLGFISPSTMGSVHVLSYGTWFGTVAYTTFVAGITMFKNLPRKVFGNLQAKLFPKYFSLCSITLVLQVRSIDYRCGSTLAMQQLTRLLSPSHSSLHSRASNWPPKSRPLPLASPWP